MMTEEESAIYDAGALRERKLRDLAELRSAYFDWLAVKYPGQSAPLLHLMSEENLRVPPFPTRALKWSR